jgi:hypothetical protein
LQRGQLVLGLLALALLQAEQVRQLGDLALQAAERGVLAAGLLAHVELGHHEHGQQECDHQQQRGEDVDVARPEQVVTATRPA